MWSVLHLILSFTFGIVLGDTCYQDWHYFEGSCYGFGETLLTWPDSQEMCETFDSKLAEIETSAENEWLKSQARSRNVPIYWLGGTDVFHEGSWQWVSTREDIYPFSDWAPGEPTDSAGHEDCLTMWDQVNYQWNDVPCDRQYNFICEARPNEEPIVG